ncbi:MAG: GDP-mannose 4,6-dehydratase, partial [Cyclobacteriaceae bacterium]
SCTIRDLIRMTFEEVGIKIEFKGKGLEEVGIVMAWHKEEYSLPSGTEIVSIDPNYFRPSEVEELVGDATKAREKLGWKPKHDLNALISEMISSDLKIARKELKSLALNK